MLLALICGSPRSQCVCKPVWHSVSRAFLPRGVNQNIQGIDYIATAPGCYWVNTEKTPGIYPTGVAYGVLAVFKVDANVLQLMANESSLWWRMNVNDRWSAWRQA